MQAQNVSYVDLMNEINRGFGKSMSELAAVFGVSRQTLCNWMSGEKPNRQHQNKIIQLAAAAKVFINHGFVPTVGSLDRTVADGKTFIELIGEGVNGSETADLLIRIEIRGRAARQALDRMLASRTRPQLTVADFGRPTFNEDI